MESSYGYSVIEVNVKKAGTTSHTTIAKINPGGSNAVELLRTAKEQAEQLVGILNGEGARPVRVGIRERLSKRTSTTD